MTAHAHAQYVPGCYRCDLGQDEVEVAPFCHDIPFSDPPVPDQPLPYCAICTEVTS